MKNWKLKEKAPDEFLKKHEFPRQISQLLWNRGLTAEKEIENFFAADYEKTVHNPFLFKGMKQAAERIVKAVEAGEEIVVYGDYDADGICSSAILHSVFKLLGANFRVYIPDRFKGGYGLTLKSINEVIAEKNPDLIITVDCGISNREEVDFLNEQGIDAVILDHHLPPAELPAAVAIVDAKQENDTYPFKFLCATGVVFKTCRAILETQKIVKMTDVQRESFEKWLLDLVAIATVADMVPLFDENRIFVKYGLKVCAKTRRLGLKALMLNAGIKKKTEGDSFPVEFDVSEDNLGFTIGPRVNAASRVNHANDAFELLISESPKEAEWLAEKLSATNRERQNLTEQVVVEAEKRIAGKPLPKIIIEGADVWSSGVIGIAAAKILDKYHRPVFLYREEDGILRGSCRSISGFNVVEAMGRCGDIFEAFGGHAVAAGFTIKKENLEKFKTGLLEIAEKELKEKDLIPGLDIEAAISPAEIDHRFYHLLEKFRPFGKENPAPVFSAEKLEVYEARLVGNGEEHLKLRLGKGGEIFPAIAFNFGAFAKDLKIGDLVDAAFEIEENVWNGRSELQLKIADIKKS